MECLNDSAESVLPLVPQKRSCNYAFERDILIVDGVIDWGDQLIEACNRTNLWSQASLAGVGPSGPNGPVVEQTYYSEDRNNDAVFVSASTHTDFASFEFWLCQAFHSCVYAYKAMNKHLHVKSDTHFSVLRYRPGEHFREHVDTIAGHTSWGSRQLSAVAFLNDDFEGGQLGFPRQGVLITPKAGTIVLFPSSFTHPHEARDVTKGMKYSAVTWFA